MRRKMVPKAPRKMFEDLPGGKWMGSRAMKEKRSDSRRKSKRYFTPWGEILAGTRLYVLPFLLRESCVDIA